MGNGVVGRTRSRTAGHKGNTVADIIQIQPQARVQLKKNTGDVLYNQEFAPAKQTYTSHVGMAITVATNTSVILSQGNIADVVNIMLKANNACTIKVNSQATGTPMVGTNSVWVAFSTSLTAVKVLNVSTTNTVTVNYVLTN